MLLAVLSLALAPQVWIVDAQGGGDFLDLPAAVAAASDGDVLRILPGNYTGTTITKDLALLGAYGAPFASWVNISGPDLVLDGSSGAAGATLTGLRVSNLELRDFDGRVRVDDCSIFDGRIADCADVVLARCWVTSSQTPFALTIFDSNVLFQDGDLRGSTDWVTADGNAAVATVGDVSLEVVSSRVVGGDAGFGEWSVPTAASAVQVSTGQLDLVVRGSSTDLFAGGYDDYGQAPAVTVWSGVLNLTWSGVAFGQPPVPAVAPSEPYIELGPRDQTTPDRRLLAYGPAGAVCYTVFCKGSNTNLPSGLAGDDVRVDLTQQFGQALLVLQGQDVHATKFLSVPTGPALVGFEVDAQAVVALPGGELFVTNQVQAVLVD